MSMVGSPSRSTYWVAICPLSLSRSSTPSHRHESALAVGDRHGVDIARRGLLEPGAHTLATRVRTSMLWWRPMVLKVSVGAFSLMSTISP